MIEPGLTRPPPGVFREGIFFKVERIFNCLKKSQNLSRTGRAANGIIRAGTSNFRLRASAALPGKLSSPMLIYETSAPGRNSRSKLR